MPGEIGSIFHYRQKEVLSVLRQVFSNGRYRRIFGILPQIRLFLTSCQKIADILAEHLELPICLP